MKYKDQSLVAIFYIKETSNLIASENFGNKGQKQTFTLLEMTEFISCLCILQCEKYPYPELFWSAFSRIQTE